MERERTVGRREKARGAGPEKLPPFRESRGKRTRPAPRALSEGAGRQLWRLRQLVRDFPTGSASSGQPSNSRAGEQHGFEFRFTGKKIQFPLYRPHFKNISCEFCDYNRVILFSLLLIIMVSLKNTSQILFIFCLASILAILLSLSQSVNRDKSFRSVFPTSIYSYMNGTITSFLPRIIQISLHHLRSFHPYHRRGNARPNTILSTN